MKRQRRLVAAKGAFGTKSTGMISDQRSPVERLMQDFESHENHEELFLRKYRDMVEKTNNPMVKFLVELILTDEEKHRVVLHTISSRLRAAVNWTHAPNALESLDGDERDTLIKATEDFIKVEQKELRDYRKLARTARRYYEGLFTLLLAAIIHDSEKHVQILEFLRDKLEAA